MSFAIPSSSKAVPQPSSITVLPTSSLSTQEKVKNWFKKYWPLVATVVAAAVAFTATLLIADKIILAAIVTAIVAASVFIVTGGAKVAIKRIYQYLRDQAEKKLHKLTEDTKNMDREIEDLKEQGIQKLPDLEALIFRWEVLQNNKRIDPSKQSEISDTLKRLKMQQARLEKLEGEVRAKEAQAVFGRFEAIEKNLFELQMNAGKKGTPTAHAIFSRLPTEEFIKIFEEILEAFDTPEFHRIYGYNSYYDGNLKFIKLGDPVPAYLANAPSGSEYSLKDRAMRGLRNLMKFGTGIYDELKEKTFIPGAHHYDYGRGLNKMAYYTGNTVDLEQHIDAQNEKEAREIAAVRLKFFREEFKDFESQFPYRNIDESRYIPHASSNTEKGHAAIWSFHVGGYGTKYAVNVPNTTEVINTVLKAPYYFVMSYLILKQKYRGAEFQEKLRDFFDRSLSTKCFNDKMEKIFEFNQECRKLIKPVKTEKEKAQDKYGREAVQNAFEFHALYTQKFLLDPTIVPKEGAKQDPEKWKMTALAQYTQRAKELGYWEKALFVEDGHYSLFNEDLIGRLMKKVVENDKYADYKDRFS